MNTYNSVKAVYEREYDFANSTRSIRGEDEQFPYIVQSLKYVNRDQKDITILDAGCGDGMYVNALKQIGYTQITGLDLFDAIADKSIKYVKGSIDNLPFSDDTFDFVYCTSCLYYLRDVERGIKELARVLKKDGILLITITTKFSLFSLQRKIKKVMKFKNTDHIEFYIFKHCSFKYAAFYKNNGLRVIKVDGFRMLVCGTMSKIVRKIIRIKTNNPEFDFKRGFSKSRIIGGVKSILGYHAVVMGKKE